MVNTGEVVTSSYGRSVLLSDVRKKKMYYSSLNQGVGESY